MDQREQAADALLEIFRRNRGWNEGAARLQLLKFFEAWGFDDPATIAARRRLSALLFS
jgi:putative thioredoxin